MKQKLLYIFVFITSVYANAQNFDPLATEDYEAQEVWVHSILDTLTIEEKIGQLFMVAAYSNLDEKHEKFITNLIQKS